MYSYFFCFVFHLQITDFAVAVGTPIMITVEDVNDVALFKDYVHQAAPVVAAAAVVHTPPPPVQSAPVIPASAPVVPPPTPIIATPTMTPPPVPAAAVVTATTTSFSTAYGLSVSKTSPLAKTFSEQQSIYIKKYGTTGQLPIL
jgi:hypothetical protein